MAGAWAWCRRSGRRRRGGGGGQVQVGVEPREFGRSDIDLDEKITLLGAWVQRGIRGDVVDGAVQLRRRALVEGVQLDAGLLADDHPVNIGRQHTRLDDQFVGAGHDLHQHLARADHTTGRVDAQVGDGAGYRRAQFRKVQCPLGRTFAFDQLEVFRLHFF